MLPLALRRPCLAPAFLPLSLQHLWSTKDLLQRPATLLNLGPGADAPLLEQHLSVIAGRR